MENDLVKVLPMVMENTIILEGLTWLEMVQLMGIMEGSLRILLLLGLR
jgi:hypothetical protein